MKPWGKSKKLFREIIDEKNTWRRDLRDETIKLNRKNRENEHKYQYDLMRRICKQAGIDFEKYEKEIERKQRTKQKNAMKNLLDLEGKVKERVAREKEVFDRSAALYAKATEGAYRQIFHNPALRMKIPWDYWTEITSPTPGMYGGGGEGSTIPRAEANPAAELEVHPTSGEEVPLELHPACVADVGPDYCCGSADASLSQHLVFEHDAPRGDWFWVDRIWVALSAFGVVSRYSGHAVFALSQTLELRNDIEWGFRASIRQEGWSSGVVIMEETLANLPSFPRWFWESEMTSSEPIIYDDTLRTSPSSVILLQGEESGGGRVQVHLEFWCRAYANTKDAFASINFAPPNGIKIREVTLIPYGE